jgi:hypothetical protein
MHAMPLCLCLCSVLLSVKHVHFMVLLSIYIRSRCAQPSRSCCTQFRLFSFAGAIYLPGCVQFIKDASEQLWLVGLHSVTLDPQQSRGSAATFTERWGEFLAGAGPPPAPHLPQHTSYGRNSHSATACDSPSHSSFAPASPAAEQQREREAAGSSSGRGGGGCSAVGRSSPLQQLNRQFFPLLAVNVSELPSCRPQSASAAGATGAVRVSAEQCPYYIMRACCAYI